MAVTCRDGHIEDWSKRIRRHRTKKVDEEEKEGVDEKTKKKRKLEK